MYIPLPNHLHAPWTLRAAAAGKHVLCEKPLAMSSAEAQEMVDGCRSAGVALMEAFMYRLHPLWVRVRELVRDGAVGELEAIQAFFSYRNLDPLNIRNVSEFGGGALMDIGCYPVNVARMMFDAEPISVAGVVRRDPQFGTDALTSAVLDFGGRHATFTCSTQLEDDQRVHLIGTEGRLLVEIPFNIPPDRPTRIIRAAGGRPPVEPGIEIIEVPPADQYAAQCDAFSAAIRVGAAGADPAVGRRRQHGGARADPGLGRRLNRPPAGARGQAARVIARSTRRRNGGRWAARFENGSTSGCRSMPSVSGHELAAGPGFAPTRPGYRAANSARNGLVGQRDAVLDVGREVRRPGGRDDVALQGRARPQLDRRVRGDRRVDPLVEVELVPGVEEDPEERVAQTAVDDGLQLTADLADVEGAVPLGDGLEVRGDEAVDVVLHPVRQLRRVVDDEAGPAVERAPDPERDGERVAPLDRPVAGAQQPVPRPRPGGEHEVARERRTVPGEELRRLPLGHAGPETIGARHRPRATSGTRTTRTRPAARPR